MTTLYVQAPTLYLAGSGVIIGATSITLTTLTDIYGNVLTMADFGALGYLTLEPDTTNAEGATFTGVTANANGTYTLTGVKTVTAKSPITQTSGLVRNHSGGTKVVVTDNVGFWDTFVNKNNDATMVGYLSGPTPTAVDHYATKAYADGLALASAVASGTATVGYVKLSSASATPTAPVVVETADARVPTQGENDALVGNNTDIAVGTGNKMVTQTGLQHNAEKYAADAGANDTYAITLSPIPTSYTVGMVVYFKANTANTGTATLNVNGLGAKTIVTGVSTTLATGDIVANQLCTLIYDGTNFVLQSPKSMQASNGTATISSSTTVTVTTGFRPKHITIHSIAGSGSGANYGVVFTDGGYDATTNSMWCRYSTFDTSGNVSTAGLSTAYALNITYGTSGPTATTVVINNITDTGFDTVYTKGTTAVVFYWTAIA